MRGLLLFILSISSCLSLRAQNLVPNGGFDLFNTCPYFVSQIDFADGWTRPTQATSDYFNTCLSNQFSVGAPNNQFGNEVPRSGSGYAGFYAFYSNGSFTQVPNTDREYVSRALNVPLQVGETYLVEFYISLGEASQYGVSDLGLLLSTSSPTRPDELAINQSPQVRHLTQTPLINKQGWTRISACVVVDSAYQYLTIGNFNDGPNTVSTFVGSNTSNLHYSYYFVDDVSIRHLSKPTIIGDSAACESTELLAQTGQTSGGFLWSDGSTGNSNLVESSGYYSVSTTLGSCTVSSDPFHVQIVSPPSFSLGRDTSLSFCEEVNFQLRPLGLIAGAYAFVWSTGSVDSMISPTRGGLYELEVTAPSGCSSSAAIVLDDACDGTFFLPNAFTPNGDGLNDVFRPIGHNIAIERFEIYNRWGEMIYQSDDSQANWAPTTEPSGLYVWKVHYQRQVNGRMIDELRTGSVSLLR